MISVPTVMEKHEQNLAIGKSGKLGKKIVMEIETIPKKSCNFSTASHESRTQSSDNSISI